MIGEAPNISVPPKDRLWFKEHCNCAGLAGCGVFGSKRFTRRLDAATKVLKQQNAAAEAEAAAHKKAAMERAAAEKKAAASRAAARAKREKEVAAFRDTTLFPSFRIDPLSPAERTALCLRGVEPLVSPEPQSVADYYCEQIEVAFRETPEFARLRAHAEEVCKPFRECVEGNRDCTAENKAREDACRPLPTLYLCDALCLGGDTP